MTEKREPEPEDKRQSDDLELPEEAAEDVKGGANKWGDAASKVANQKLAPDKLR